MIVPVVFNSSTVSSDASNEKLPLAASNISGWVTNGDFAFLYALPLLLSIFAFKLLKKKPKRVARVRKNKSTVIAVHNFGKTPFYKLVLIDVLPSGSKSSRKTMKTVLGPTLQWRKKQLKPAEKWIVKYSSTSAAKKGKLRYCCENKMQEEFF